MKILRAESREQRAAPLLTFCPSTFSAAPLACGRTLLVLLAVLSAVLLAVLSAVLLAAPTAAQAQTTVWSATLTAKAVSAGNGCQNSSSSRCSNSMILSEDEFSYDGHDYAISGIRETASSLQIAFTRTIATGASQSLVFMVDGEAFPFGDGTITPSARTWSSAAAAAISWSVGQDVAVSLVEPAPVWSGTLTVKASGVVLGCSNGFTNNHCRDQLSDDDFTHDSRDYAITSLFLRRNGELQFVVGANLKTATQALTLNVGGTAFAFEDADTKTILSRTWNNSALGWTAGDTVSLTLTEGTTTTPDPTITPDPVMPACGRSHWDRDKRLATQLLDASCEYVARNRNNLADGQVSAEELAEIRPLRRRLREIVDDLPCGFGYRYYDDAGEQTLYKGAPPECPVRTTKSGGGGLPWEDLATGDPEPPAAPGNVSASASGPSRIEVSWSAPKGEVTGYEVEWSADGSGSWTAADPAHSGTATGYSDTGLDAGTTRHYRVRAVNGAGSSDWSLTSTATEAVAAAEPQEPPAKPRNLEAVVNDDGTVTLTWNDPGDDSITGYQILRRNRDTSTIGVFEVHVEDTGSAATSYVDRDVTPETRYNYRVKARNESGLSLRSNFVKADTPSAPNSPATGAPAISGTAQVGETLTADVSGIADADGLDTATFSYQWIVSDGGADFEIPGETGPAYTLIPIDAGLVVMVRVSFTDDAGNEETLTSAATSVVAEEQ